MPPIHVYRSFGVFVPFAQLQMGPVVTFLICPSVHSEDCAAGTWKTATSRRRVMTSRIRVVDLFIASPFEK
jgi:hypothetical protein